MNSKKFTQGPRSPGYSVAFCPDTIVDSMVVAMGRMISKLVIALIVAIYFILH